MRLNIFSAILCTSIVLSNQLTEYGIHRNFAITYETLTLLNTGVLEEKKIESYNNPIIAFGASLLIPGLGQYYLDDTKYWKRIFLYGVSEVIGISGMLYYNKKGTQEKENYQDWADEHWSFERWLYNYDKINTGEYYIFDNDISSGSHYIQFVYQSKTYRTTDEDFYIEIYQDIVQQSNGVEELEALDFQVYKSHDYYEEVGKYDHFFAGWDDSSEFEIVDIGELNITSDNKNKYLDFRDVSKGFYNFAEYFGIVLFLNHAVSATDALILAQLSNRKIRVKSISRIEKNNSLSIGFKLTLLM